MNNTKTTSGGWANCSLRSTLKSWLASSDSSFRASVKEVDKTYYDVSARSTKTVSDTIWIPSVYELEFNSSPIESSGVRYSNFTKKVTLYPNTSGLAYNTRTAASSIGYFWINASGTAVQQSNSGATADYRVVIGVCT